MLNPVRPHHEFSSNHTQAFRLFWICPDCKDEAEIAEVLQETDLDDCAICLSDTDRDFRSKPRHAKRSNVWYWLQAKDVVFQKEMDGNRFFSANAKGRIVHY